MKTLSILAATSFLALAATQADATIYLGLQSGTVNNGLLTQVATDNGTGGLSYVGSYDGFDSLIGAQGSPKLAQPGLQTATINTRSSGAGLLSIFITQTNLTANVPSLMSSFTANSFFGGARSVTMSTFVDANNGIFTGNQLATATFTSIGSRTEMDALGLSSPYSETVRFDLTFGGEGSFNNTVNLSGVAAVPEPASWAMMLGGFGMLGGALRRRRTTVAFA